MEEKLLIQNEADRNNIVQALANSGYSVRVEVETLNTHSLLNKKFWVVYSKVQL